MTDCLTGLKITPAGSDKNESASGGELDEVGYTFCDHDGGKPYTSTRMQQPRTEHCGH